MWKYILAAVLLVLAVLAGQAWPQSTQGTWSGCFQSIYVPDPDTGVIRKLTRNEGPRGVRPGTGTWGKWGEDYCEVPGSPGCGYPIGSWPKPISAGEVKRLLGPLADRLNADRKVETTETGNFTGYPFGIIGPRMMITKDEWNKLPAVLSRVPQKLSHYAEDTGEMIPGEPYPPPGDPRLRAGSGWRPKTKIYHWRKPEPGPLKPAR
jgi:hypothetical protein